MPQGEKWGGACVGGQQSFGMELVKNPAAMNRFSQLTEEEKRALVDGSFNVTSPEEMRAYMQNFMEGYPVNRTF